jgi:hypothetical protein
MSFIICFRHQFLRNNNKQIPQRETFYAEDCPWVLNLDDLLKGKKKWAFEPHKLMNLPFQRIDFCEKSEKEIETKFKKIAKKIEKEYLPWCHSVNPEIALTEMKKKSEDWWVARLWQEDYEAFLNSRD